MLLHEKFLQYDWLRAVVFQLFLKFEIPRWENYSFSCNGNGNELYSAFSILRYSNALYKQVIYVAV